MNLIQTSVLLSLAGLVSLTGCVPAYLAHPAESQQQAYADAMGKPSHPATTAQQWIELESRAAALAQEGKMEVGAPLHVAAQGYSAEQKFSVRGGHCYRLGIGWAFDAPTQASVMFQPRADGKRVNDFVGGANGRLENRSGTLEFCADRDGEAALTLSALGANGAIAMNELLEYAVAFGEKQESPAEAKVRRGRDEAAGSQARANQETNIAIAKERKRRALEDRCRQCREEFRLCQVEAAYARKHPRSGVTYTSSCEHKFGICATGKYSGTPEEMAQCGAPPL